MAKGGVDPESRQIGRRLKALRIESGREVEDLVADLGISAPSWYAYEGARQTFPYTRLPDVAKALGISTGQLIGRLFPVERQESRSFSDRLLAQTERLFESLAVVDGQAIVASA